MQQELITSYYGKKASPIYFKSNLVDKLADAFDPAFSATYGPSNLLVSMLNIDRCTSLKITTITFKENWLIENGCQKDRSLSIKLSNYAGNLDITGFSISN